MVGIVASRFNGFITERLVEGCVKEFERRGMEYKVLWVPGAFEIPFGIARLHATGKYDGFVAIGCIMKGETRHWEILASSVINNLIRFSVDNRIPVSHAVLTVDNVEQAINRSGGKFGNKGSEAAKALIELIDTFNDL